MLTADQLALRRQGITATDVAALSGVHPYRAPINVYIEKTGDAPAFVENERVRWGNLLEPLIRQDYARRHRVDVVEPGTLQHAQHDWAMATPDGVALLAALPVRGLEIKTHGVRVAEQYGEPGTDQVPGYVLVQCAWNLYVSGLDRWDVVGFWDNQPHDFQISRDEELIGQLVEVAERFRRDHLVPRRPPVADGSRSFADYLSRRHPQQTADLLSIDDQPEVRRLIDELRVHRELAASSEHIVAVEEQRVKAIIGDHEGITWTEGGKMHKITWKASKDRATTDVRAVIADLEASLSPEQQQTLRELTEHHTTTKTGARTFRVPNHWNREHEL